MFQSPGGVTTTSTRPSPSSRRSAKGWAIPWFLILFLPVVLLPHKSLFSGCCCLNLISETQPWGAQIGVDYCHWCSQRSFPILKYSVTFWQLSHLLRIRTAPVFSQKRQRGDFVQAVNIWMPSYLPCWHYGVFEICLVFHSPEVVVSVDCWSSAGSSLSCTRFVLSTLGVRMGIFRIRNPAFVRLIILGQLFPLALRRS